MQTAALRILALGAYRMTSIRSIAASLLFSAVVFSLALTTAFAQPKPGHIDEVLREMDAASAKFKSAEADFRWELYERVVKQVTTVQTGSIYFVKDTNNTEMGAKILSPAPKFLEFRDGTLRIFDPGPDHLTTVSSKQNQAQIEAFLTLGFGGSGKDLAKAWTISDLGTEAVGDVETAKLDLVPKDPSVRNNCTHITIWVDASRGISLKQEFFMPSEDTRTSYYSNVRLNQKIDEKKYAIKTDSKTTKS
jgi:outer membrane lipoprotein-sorting protein